MPVIVLEDLKLDRGLRLLGLDLGEKTIGLALSDTSYVITLFPAKPRTPIVTCHCLTSASVCKTRDRVRDQSRR